MIVIVFFRRSFFEHFQPGKSSGAVWFVFSLHFLPSFLSDSESLPPRLPSELVREKKKEILCKMVRPQRILTGVSTNFRDFQLNNNAIGYLTF